MKKVFFRNPLRQALGLMFQKPATETLYIFSFDREMTASFHMLFVFRPIDIYFLDKSKKVVDVKRGFKPFTFYRPKRPYWYAVETEAGLLSQRVDQALTF